MRKLGVSERAPFRSLPVADLGWRCDAVEAAFDLFEAAFEALNEPGGGHTLGLEGQGLHGCEQRLKGCPQLLRDQAQECSVLARTSFVFAGLGLESLRFAPHDFRAQQQAKAKHH
jgi:hypothetical protein